MTGFGEQVPGVEPAAAVHHEHHRGDVHRRQRNVDHGRNLGPGSRAAAGALEERVDEIGEKLAHSSSYFLDLQVQFVRRTVTLAPAFQGPDRSKAPCGSAVRFAADDQATE
ncbi:hypothetical protein [Streptomyces niveus]|uniref:hypothetical protein n=1 Tax=Streptomyces niveus TaxID=193462 RepID=UPI0036A5A7E3